MQITKDRKKRVIDLYFNQHKTYAEIAQIEKMSPRDIHAIIKEEQSRQQRHKDQQRQEEISSKAYKLFSEKKSTVDVAIALNLRGPEVTKLHKEYCKLRGRDILNLIHKETNGKIWSFWKLYQQLVMKKGMSIEEVVNVVEIAIYKLPYMETLYKQVEDEVNKLQYARENLVNDIRAMEHKVSILNRIAFSSEQDCKRTEQKVQELTTQKDRIEKLIVTMLSDDDEDYTKLKAIVKEIVKAALSENKQVISVSFAVLIQTLKDNPEKFHLIYNTHTTANENGHVNDNTNTIKYAEFNRDSLLDLAEKHYENLVEALTKNAIDIAASGSSLNTTLSLPHSSSTLPSSENQSDTHRKEEPKFYHNNKGDIAD